MSRERVVLGVLFQIAVGARLLDVEHVLGTLDLAQPLELVPQGLLPARGHRELGHGYEPSFESPCESPSAWYSCNDRTRILPARSSAIAPTAARAADIVV